jgi:alpha-beta hydrolase superfamily lysophospholipase
MSEPIAYSQQTTGTHNVLKFSLSDKTELAFRLWSGNQAKPVVAYFHGIEGHSQWFEQTALYLNLGGITVFAFDRRGSGLNKDNPGSNVSASRLVKDVHESICLVKQWHPGQKVFGIGNCFGARAAIVAASQNPDLLDGLILTAPAIKPCVDVSLSTKFQIALCWLFRSKRLFQIPLGLDMFTDNPDWRQYLLQDELKLEWAKADFFVSGFFLSLAARQKGRRIKVPLLVVQAGRDRIIDGKATKAWFDACPQADKTFVEFPQAAHSLDFEAQPDQYWQLLLDWIDTHAGDKKS